MLVFHSVFTDIFLFVMGYLCKYISICYCYQMIHVMVFREYRNSIEFRPLRESDPVEDHQITVCIRKRPLNKKGKSDYRVYRSDSELCGK